MVAACTEVIGAPGLTLNGEQPADVRQLPACREPARQKCPRAPTEIGHGAHGQAIGANGQRARRWQFAEVTTGDHGEERWKEDREGQREGVIRGEKRGILAGRGMKGILARRSQQTKHKTRC